jgi:hypothetical protein
MILFSKTYTRSDITIPFHNQVLDNTEYKQHLTENYINTGKLIEQWMEFSEDSLVMTYKALWTDRESFDEHQADPILNIYWTDRDEYCSSTNIIQGTGTFESM